MPPRRAVELRVGGQTYRVVATDDDQNVQRLAELVDRKYLEVVPTRGITPQQGIFLTAMALADEARVLAEAAKALTEEVEEQRSRAARLEGERDRSTHLATRAREAVARLLQKVDGVLGAAAGVAAPQDAARAASPAAEDPRSVGATTGSPPPSHDLRQSGPRSGARSSAPPVPPPANDLPPASPEAAPADESDVLLFELLQAHREQQPREVQQSLPRGGLRLLRQTASSWGPGTPAKPGPDDESR